MNIAKTDLKASLLKYFGFDSFKGEQEMIISSLLDGKNTFVIMPTGGGKSLCYQLPALISDGTAIVVSPLIALMKNQVDAIRQVSDNDGVAHFLNSQREDALRYIKSGVHFIYFTQDSDLTVSELKPVRNGAMFLAEGRSFVVDGSGCIGFEKARNRIKLIVNEHCFRRRFAKVDPVLTSLRSVVEVVKKDI